MENKQTAVQWLFEQFFKVKWGAMQGNMPTIFEQALQMEREQIVQAAADHCYPTAQIALNDAERYYEQHYTQTLKP
jgi:hypothetical protein